MNSIFSCSSLYTSAQQAMLDLRASRGVRMNRLTLNKSSISGSKNLSYQNSFVDVQQKDDICRQYPPINTAFPGIKVLSVEPPVYIVKKFLSDKQCISIIDSVKGKKFTQVEYDNSVLLDQNRLLLLLPVFVLSSLLPLLTDQPMEQRIQQVGQSTVASFSVIVLFLKIVPVMVKKIVKKVFSGKKYSTGAPSLKPTHPAYDAIQQYFTSLSCLLYKPRNHFEIPTVSHYQQGEYQRAHFDARSSNDKSGYEDLMKGNGQRMAQCLVYLNTLESGQGGETRFLSPELNDLHVKPNTGDLLVFFPAFVNGQPDDRMLHSGEPVLEGEKWILNSWMGQKRGPQWND